MPTRVDQRLGGLPVFLGVLVVAELVLLRTATRTLIHIPGLGRYEAPISFLAEVGRYSYYLAAVLLVATLATLGYRSLLRGPRRQSITGLGTLLFLVVAGAGRLGALGSSVVGWFSLVIVLVLAVLAWRGLPGLPIGLFVTGSSTAGVAVLGQTTAGGLTGPQVDVLFIVAESSLVLAALSAPLLLEAAPRRPAVVAGVVAALVGMGAMKGGGSTLSILILWNLGVPGWLPGIAYALALGSLVTTLWSAVASRQWLTAVGVVLLVAGGVGVISTYQTGLVIAGILLIVWSMTVPTHPDDEPLVAGASHDTQLSLAGSSS